MDYQDMSLDRWHDLRHAYERCEGFALRSRLRVFRLSLYAFDKNFDNLLVAIAAMKPDDQPTDDTLFEFADRSEPLLLEVCRCLQNFVSSAMTLVDQSRALYEKIYEPDGKIPQYSEEIKNRFKENPLHQFIQGLRNMTVHYRLPAVAYTVNRQFRIGSSSISYEVCLQKGDLLQFDSWNQHARRFLDDFTSNLDLTKIANDYHQIVVDFHNWFADRQFETHSQQFEEVEKLEKELRQMADELRRRHREKWSASSDEHSGRPKPADQMGDLRD